jgi:hypothetical protein
VTAEQSGRLLVLHNPSPELLAFVSALARLDAMISTTDPFPRPVSLCRLAARRQAVLQASGAFTRRLKREVPQLNQVMGIHAVDLEWQELKQDAAATGAGQESGLPFSYRTTT